MNFSFFCAFADGTRNSIDTHNIFEAQRRALSLGAVQLFCKNPGTKSVTELNFK